ncbi:hypothetical protein [Paenibacillus sp. GCM10012306]|uniref:hypothetical protein n=1 Tax=Paenibacillus sp. GCM10012306 TaxID=3317342 RepID=UPI003613D7FE
MDIEKRAVTLLDGDNPISGDLYVYEESPKDADMVLLKVVIGERSFISEEVDCFSAFVSIRKELEQENLQIACNGSAKSVYPSRMQLTMGYGRKAYKLFIGQQAKIEDVVDIFDCDTDLEFVTVEEQSNFYAQWIKSVVG